MNKKTHNMTRYSPSDKIQFEIKKVQLEIEHLKNPWKYNSGYIVAFVTFIIGSLTFMIQYSNTDFEYQRISIFKERLSFENMKLNEEKDRIWELINKNLIILNELNDKKDKAIYEINLVKNKIESVKNDISLIKYKLSNNESISRAEFKNIENTFNGILSINSSLASLPYIIDDINKLNEKFMLTASVLSLKKHSENPVNEPIGKGIAKLLTEGAITNVPALSGIIQNNEKVNENNKDNKAKYEVFTDDFCDF